MDIHDRQRTDVSSLAARLRQRIKSTGPISFRDWMDGALYDEHEGYYCRRDHTRWGRAGDYRTSAERSTLFAATFAGYFAALHKELGAPREWTILESGAGNGDFAHGVLHALQRDYPTIFNATRYIVDERSDDAREKIKVRLEPFSSHIEFRRINEITDSLPASIIFSNELLDALAVHRVIMRSGKLLELCVALNAADEFIWIECEPTTPRLAAHFQSLQITLNEGQAAEVNLAAEDWILRAASLINSGYLITVDYGLEAFDLYNASSRHEGTLRAFRQHQFADDILAQPGHQDLTATINWTQMERAGERAGLQTVLFARQDQFLLQAGLLNQLERATKETQSEAELAALRLGAREMILPGGISESFQVLVQKKLMDKKPQINADGRGLNHF